MTQLSSATIGSDDRSWSQREVVDRRAAGNGCSMSSTPRSHELGQQRARRRRGVQPVLASTRIGPSNTARTASQRREVLRAAALDLERREVGRAGGALGDDLRLVDADREVGRRDRRRTGRAARGPGRRGPCRRGRAGRCRGRTWRRRCQRMAASIAPAGAAPRPGVVGRRASPTASRSSGNDRGHRLGRLAVEPVRVALPHPDDAREPVVAQLDDDRRHARSPSAWSVAGDAERVAQARGAGPRASACRLIAGDPRQRVDAPRGSPPTAGPAPKRNGSSVGSPVSAAIAAMTGPRLVVVAVERGVERDRHDLRRRDEPGDPLVQVDERRAATRSGTRPRAGGRSRARRAPACGP